MKKIIVILAFTVLIFGYAGFNAYKSSRNRNMATNGNNGQRNIIPVTKAVVTEKTLINRISYPGDIVPLLRADISPKITGVIEDVRPTLGQFVSAGDLIARIDDSEYKEQLNNANISLQLAKVSLEKQGIETENLKNQYERSLELFENNMLSKEELETIETKYKTGLATLHYQQVMVEQEKNRIEQARINLEYTVIKAPFSGFIEAIYLEKGTLASPGKNIVSIIDISKVKITVDVSERDYPLITRDMMVRFNVAGQDTLYTGVVSSVSPSINPESRTAKIEIMVDNAHGELRPGMTATVIFETETFQNIPSAPREVLYKFEDKTGVFLIHDDNSVEFVPVSPAVIDEGFIGFDKKGGISPGQRLILLGGHLLKTGDRVIVEGETQENKVQN